MIIGRTMDGYPQDIGGTHNCKPNKYKASH